MEVTIWHVDGGCLRIKHMAGDNLLEFIQQWREGDAPTLSIVLDGDSVTYISRRNIIRVDVDEPTTAAPVTWWKKWSRK